MKKFRKGAASFYIVAISTLILVIIAASFAAVVISEVTRTSNDDLAQSAYDSALAGVEDAKLVYYNYQKCKNGASSDSGFSCTDIINLVEDEGAGYCDMVADILGRVKDDDNGVPVQEGRAGNDMQQYYTCVKIANKTRDVLATVTESSPEYIVRVKFDGISANNIKKVKVKWYSDSDDENNSQKRMANFENGGLFPTDATIPAVISVGMIQTSKTFSLSDFDMTQGNQTDRGTVYLVPYLSGYGVGGFGTGTDKFIKAWSNDSITQNGNIIGKDGFLKSNDKTAKNLPYLINCYNGKEYACSVDIEIPEPVNGNRSDDTFMFRISLPYGGPSTSFALEFYCGENEICSAVENDSGEEGSNLAVLENVQVSIDSTGKANDLYRRIETRFDTEGGSAYAYPSHAVQLLNNNNNNSGYTALDKSFYTTSEYNF